MEHTRSPIQVYYLFKSFVLMFMIQAVIVLFAPMQVISPIWYQVLAVNLIVGIVLGWYLYKQWYHIRFSYDSDGFQLRKGKNPPTNYRWKEFERVSLARNEYNEFVVRLYQNEDHVEIPVSKLRLNPFEFRSHVIGYVTKAATGVA